MPSKLIFSSCKPVKIRLPTDGSGKVVPFIDWQLCGDHEYAVVIGKASLAYDDGKEH